MAALSSFCSLVMRDMMERSTCLSPISTTRPPRMEASVLTDMVKVWPSWRKDDRDFSRTPVCSLSRSCKWRQHWQVIADGKGSTAPVLVHRRLMCIECFFRMNYTSATVTSAKIWPRAARSSSSYLSAMAESSPNRLFSAIRAAQHAQTLRLQARIS